MTETAADPIRPQPERIVFHTDSPEKTHRLGAALGRRLDGGARIALRGGLGAGKTLFVQGLAAGLDVPGDYVITSPTYTLVNEYPGRLRLFHVDLYRLTGPVELDTLGLDPADLNAGVVAVEWAERMDPEELGPHLELTLAPAASGHRNIIAAASGLGAEDLLKAFENSRKELS